MNQGEECYDLPKANAREPLGHAREEIDEIQVVNAHARISRRRRKAASAALNGLRLEGCTRGAFLGAGGSLAAGLLGASALAGTSADAQALRVEPYMQVPGAPLSGYGSRRRTRPRSHGCSRRCRA